MQRTRVIALVAVLAALPAIPATASAAFVSVPAPTDVSGFAASQGAWLAVDRAQYESATAHISRDHGQSWTAATLPAPPVDPIAPNFSGVTVGPDGAFYLGALYRGGAGSGT
jgi:hypothetical protein